MERKIKTLVAVIALLQLSGCAGAPQNLDLHKQELMTYKNSGAYERDFNAVLAQADAYIFAKAPQVKNPAIVLDIDETSLSNWPQLEANGLTFRVEGACDHLPKGPCGLVAWNKTEKAQAFPATLALFNKAHDHGIPVFFITGREESIRKFTEENLRRAGYKDWAKLYLRPSHTSTPTASDLKAPLRAQIESQGYTIVATLGDQQSDLTGGHSGRAFKVPNPFYFIK